MSKLMDFVAGKIAAGLAKYNKRKMQKEMREKITRNFKDLDQRRYLTDEQKKEVDDFYRSMIGRTVPLYCHEYFYSRTGVFSKDYVPKDFYTVDLLPKANVFHLTYAYDDKNIYDVLFAGENIAHTILKNMNGYFYFEGQAVSEAQAF